MAMMHLIGYLALGLCGVVAEEDALPSFASLSEEVFHVLTPPSSSGAGCMDGSAYSFFVVPRARATSARTRVVVELMGGGACWSLETCAEVFEDNADRTSVPPAFLSQDGKSASDVAALAAFLGFDFVYDDAEFDDATYVMAPYCTQDVHLGSKVVSYDASDPQLASVNHNGWANVMSVLSWVNENLGEDLTEETNEPIQVVVMGCSAGSIAAPIVSTQLSDHFDRVVVLSDSFVGISSNAFVADYLPNWGVDCALGAALPGLDVTAPALACCVAREVSRQKRERRQTNILRGGQVCFLRACLSVEREKEE